MFQQILRIFLVLGMLIAHLEADAIGTYYKSLELKKSGKMEEYHRLNLQLIEEAQKENLPHYTYIGAYNSAYHAYMEQRFDDCLTHADLAVSLYAKHKKERNFNQAYYHGTHAAIWGLMERSYSQQMRPGEGWKAQREATRFWHESVGLPYEPGTFDIEAIDQIEPADRANGWRQIGREASYLHNIGRTAEARALLEKAIAQLRKTNAPASIYSVQLVDTLAEIESFIGYHERAIKLTHFLIAEMDRSPATKVRDSYIGAQLNLVDRTADFEGVTPESIEKVRGLVEQARVIVPLRLASFQRILTNLENRLANSSKGYEELEALAKKTLTEGQDLEAFYLGREALFIRAETGQKDLDAHFHKLLTDVRRTGSKRLEPRIYRRYGDWLVGQQRYPEALAVYQEALNLSRTFDWHPMMPILFGKIGLTYQRAGRPEQADATWRELEAYLAAHPDIPAHTILKGLEHQLSAYLIAGRLTEARDLANRARNLKQEGGLRPFWLTFFSDKSIADYLAFIKKESTEPPAEAPPVASLQPKSLTTVALPQTDGSATFHLIHHGAAPLGGTLIFSGPGARFAPDHTADNPAFAGDLTAAVQTIKAPLNLTGGTYLTIPVTLPYHASKSGEFTLTWTPHFGEPSSSIWNNDWGSEISEAVVLESANLSATPFLGVPVVHHIGFPKGDTLPRSLRAKGSVPLRIEYRNPETGLLLAVDADGNGTFLEEGEFATSTTGKTFPEITPLTGTRSGPIKIWLYPLPDHPWTSDIELKIELHQKNTWREFATDSLKSARE